MRRFKIGIILSSVALFVCGSMKPLLATDVPPIVVIVSQASSIEQISDRQVRRLFLGKSIKLPNGSRAALATFEPIKTAFNKQALKRSNSQVSAAWSRLKFSGKTLEPKAFSDSESLLEYVASTPNAIGYLAKSDLSESVRSIYTFE